MMNGQVRALPRLAAAAVLIGRGTIAVAQPTPEIVYKLDIEEGKYVFAYVHRDPFADRYVIDAVFPSHPNERTEARFVRSELLAISRGIDHVQPQYTDSFSYSYKDTIDRVVDDKASRRVTSFTCAVHAPIAASPYFVGNAYIPHNYRHPCRSYFTKPADGSAWPTSLGYINAAPQGKPVVASAVLNKPAIERALRDTDLLEKVASWDGSSDLASPAPAEKQISTQLILESIAGRNGGSIFVQSVRFRYQGWAVPADARLVLRSNKPMFGSPTVVAFEDIRRLVIDQSAGSCPEIRVLLKSAKQINFSRCDGNPFFAEVGDRSVQLTEVTGENFYVDNGKVIKPGRGGPLNRPPSSTFTLFTSENLMMPSGLRPNVWILGSMGVLTDDEAARMLAN